MPSPAPPEAESPYRRFTRNPYNDRPRYPGVPLPMTMTDRDGSILYETDNEGLLSEIILQDDVEALEQYFTVVSNRIPCLHELPDDDEGLFDMSLYLLGALEIGSLGAVRFLVSRELKYSDSTQIIRFGRYGFQLLNEAARWGHVEMVQFFLDNQPLYASIHDRDWKGGTAIVSAADIYSDRYVRHPQWNEVRPDKNEAVMNLLLDRGACASDFMLRDPEDGMKTPPDTVLTLAAQWSSPEMIKRLIDGGADVHAKVTRSAFFLGLRGQPNDIYDVTALFVACTHANFEAIKILIECRGVGVDVGDMICSRDSWGCLPLHWATRNQLPDDPKNIPTPVLQLRIRNVTKIVNLLLDIDPSTINVQDNQGNTPLHYATQFLSEEDNQHTAIFELLCERGADASIRNNKEETPLYTLIRHSALIEINTATIPILLSYGAKSTDVDNAGNTPLHIAAENLHRLDVVSLLLEQGADASIRNAKQDTPGHIAARGVRWSHSTRYTKWTGFTDGPKLTVDERIKLQDSMLQRIIEAGGAKLMDLPNAEGKSPREICQERRDEWRTTYDATGGQGRGRGAAKRN
ncbi:hypothetical protein ACHAPJ_011196 [Fusarium lateritium]